MSLNKAWVRYRNVLVQQQYDSHDLLHSLSTMVNCELFRGVLQDPQ